MRKLLLTLLLTMGLAVTAHAQQYDLDFVAEAAGDERAVADGTRILMDGVYVEFSATSTGGEGYAYFDDLSSGRPGGLGVCTTIDGDQCDPSSDDNLTSGETLTLSFWDAASNGNQLEVILGGLLFNDADHFAIDDNSTLLFAIGANALASTSMTGFGWSDAGLSFTFGYGGDYPNSYYIAGMLVSEVPEPSTWLMMIIGFGIVSASARRSRRHSSRIMKTC